MPAALQKLKTTEECSVFLKAAFGVQGKRFFSEALSEHFHSQTGDTLTPRLIQETCLFSCVDVFTSVCLFLASLYTLTICSVILTIFENFLYGINLPLMDTECH